MMGHPTTAVIHIPGCFGTGDRQFPDHSEKRFLAFRQIGEFGRPVVHFRIDVDRIFAVPRRHEILVPDTLQRRRKIPRAAAPDQQIPSVVKQQLCKPFVRTAAYDPLQTLVGRKRGIFLFFRQG